MFKNKRDIIISLLFFFLLYIFLLYDIVTLLDDYILNIDRKEKFTWVNRILLNGF